jgi:pimeloyl-ACP methyl ester carboxylesterase
MADPTILTEDVDEIWPTLALTIGTYQTSTDSEQNGEVMNGPTLVYLHGVGDGDQSEGWRKTLDSSLVEAGYPGLGDVRIVSPKYPHSLRYPSDDDMGAKLPPLTTQKFDREAEESFRRALERRTAELELVLGPHTPGGYLPSSQLIQGWTVKLLRQAANYLLNEQKRALVLNRVLRTLPSSGDVVIVGHSLGSVIAMDLVDRLPAKVNVSALVTIGSPAGHVGMHKASGRISLRRPSSRVQWWANFWNVMDPVCGLRGVSWLFPWALDLQLNLGPTHASLAYLEVPTVATAIGRGLFGSQSKELQPLVTVPDARLDAAESFLILTMAYAQYVRDQLKPPLRSRYQDTIELVQRDFLEALIRTYAQENKRVPRALSFLRDGHRPQPLSSLSKTDAVTVLVAIATANVIAPFEIKIPDDAQKGAMRDLAVSMGLGGQFGQNAAESVASAQKIVQPSHSWRRWALVGGGALMLALGPVGLMMAAPATAAGGAAIVGALASFGPGGMVGGLATAGALTSTGAGAMAAALAQADSSAASVESVVVQLLAAVLLRDKEGLDQDTGSWSALVELERQVSRSIQRLEPYSDEKAPSLEALRRKARAIERAMDYIVSKRLIPGITPELPPSSEGEEG